MLPFSLDLYKNLNYVLFLIGSLLCCTRQMSPTLSPRIRFSQLHFVFMTFSRKKAVTRFPTGNNKCYYLPSSPTHIITPASFRRPYLYSSRILPGNVFPPQNNFQVSRRETLVTDFRLEIRLSYAFLKANLPRKINTAGSASAACNNKIKGKRP